MEGAANSRVMAILGYHKVGAPGQGGWETWYYVPEAAFASHLRCLRENEWRVLDASAFLRGLTDPESLPERSALLTFDDGYRSVHDVVLPYLGRHHCPAVLFVPTAFIGGFNAFDRGLEPDETICNWDDLRRLKRNGVSIQSHGVTHRPFSELNEEALAQEIIDSKRALEAGVGGPVEIFSFPYGDNGRNTAQTEAILERAGYRAACLYGGGPNLFPLASPFRLARLAMGPDTDLPARLAEAASGSDVIGAKA